MIVGIIAIIGIIIGALMLTAGLINIALHPWVLFILLVILVLNIPRARRKSKRAAAKYSVARSSQDAYEQYMQATRDLAAYYFDPRTMSLDACRAHRQQLAYEVCIRAAAAQSAWVAQWGNPNPAYDIAIQQHLPPLV